MNSAVELKLENGTAHIEGELTFHTVGGVLKQIRRLLGVGSGESLTLDFGTTRRTDSAALALLLECIREARRQNRRIVYRNLPQRLLQLAKISEIDNLIDIHTDGAANVAQ